MNLAENVSLPKSIVRFSTAGSVDDGKSTCIGRLLFDTGNLFTDHLAALEAKAKSAGENKLALALVTDGLKAEREQGITIDVAYRYFSTAKRRFILADSPGHEQYTRNMATAASNADLTILLVDARNGLTRQTRRHAFVAALLGVPRLLVAVNKMDLVDFSQDRFDSLCAEFSDFASKLGVKDIRFVPICAVDGDNIVTRSPRMPWFNGEPILEYLEHVYVAGDDNSVDFRLPIQLVVQSADFRGFAGTIASGSLRVGEELIALPGGKRSKVKKILVPGPTGKQTESEESRVGEPVVVELEDQLDIGRGHLLARPNNIPRTSTNPEAMVVWFSEDPSSVGKRLIVRHTTREVRADLTEIKYVVDIDTLHRRVADSLNVNEVARISLTALDELFVDPYQKNRATGNFALIDPMTFRTVAAGMFLDREAASELDDGAERNLHHASSHVSRSELTGRWNSSGATVWMTGLSGSGKSTIARELEKLLIEKGSVVVWLDGDVLRKGLSKDLGFSAADRRENIRRTAEVAKLLNERGITVICSLVSPLADDRATARSIIGDRRFKEVYVSTSIEECERRDPHQLYYKARRGEIAEFTGVSSPYEAPENPSLVIDTEEDGADAAAKKIAALLQDT
jgi:bifunctional enzyme CysN/CysC